MSDKGLEGLLRDWRDRRTHTYASENADHYYGFEAGQQSAADEAQPFVDRLKELLASMRGEAEPALDLDESADKLASIIHGSEE